MTRRTLSVLAGTLLLSSAALAATTVTPDVTKLATAFAKANDLLGTATCTAKPKPDYYICGVPFNSRETSMPVSWYCDTDECFFSPGPVPVPAPAKTGAPAVTHE